MADNAAQVKYRSEFIAGFEKGQSLLRHTVTTEADIQASSAVFLVADSGSASAVTRGSNGKIPSRPDNLNQYTATLTEWHDKPVKTRFNIYTGQANQRRVMQETSRKVMNRKIDDDIRSALSAGTNTFDMTSDTTAANQLAAVLEMVATLGENEALDEEPFFMITPAFRSNLMTLNQFSSADYVNMKAFEGVSRSKAFNWNGINWIVDSGADGVGTATSTCYLYQKNALGHACDTENVTVGIGYDDEDDYSWARTSMFMGSKLLQNSGIIKVTYNDTAFIGA